MGNQQNFGKKRDTFGSQKFAKKKAQQDKNEKNLVEKVG